jgi:hypothetical protein
MAVNDGVSEADIGCRLSKQVLTVDLCNVIDQISSSIAKCTVPGVSVHRILKCHDDGRRQQA